MRSFRNFILFFLFTAGILSAEEILPVDKMRVVVVNFSAKGEARLEAYLADAVYESLLTALIDSNEYKVLEREKLKVIMDELKLQNSDDFNEVLRSRLGKLYNAQLVVLGSLTRIGSRYTINVRGVDVETGEAVFAKAMDTTSKELLLDLVPKIVDLISGKKSIADVEKELQEKRKKELREQEERKKEEERLKKQEEEYYKRKEREEQEARRKKEWDEAEERRREEWRRFVKNNRIRPATSAEIKTSLSITGASFLLLSVICLFPAAINGYYYFNVDELNYDIYQDYYPTPEESRERQINAGYTALGFTIAMGVTGVAGFILFSLTSGKFVMNNVDDNIRLAGTGQYRVGMDVEITEQAVGLTFSINY